MRVITWNLFHGRSVPDTPRSLLGEFTDIISGWAWDVALLQEVPPWWPEPLARASGASGRWALTSRNALPPLRRALAQRRPDVIKSNGGGCNAILVRGTAGPVVAHAARRVRVWPERRVAHAVALADGTWVANVHASTHPPERTVQDLVRAGQALRRWAGDAPILLGGDMNVARATVPGFADVGGHRIDRFFARGPLTVVSAPVTVDTQGLSDHAAVAVEVVRSGA